MGKTPQNLGERLKEAWKNPELDRTKAALEKLKGETIESLLAGSLDAFDVDLSELELSQDEKDKLKEVFKRRFEVFTAGIRKETALNSTEAEKLSAFVDDIASYTGLDKAIAESKKQKSREPLYKLVQIAKASTPLLAGISAGLMEWLKKGKKEENDKPSALETAAAKADKAMRDRKSKKGKKGKDGADENAATEEPGPGGGPSAGAGGSHEALSIEGVPAEVEAGTPIPDGSRSIDKPKAGRPKYIPVAEYSKKMTPEQFREAYYNEPDREKRKLMVLGQVAAKNVPDPSREFETITVERDGGKTKLTFRVSKHGVRIGPNEYDEDGNPKWTDCSVDGPIATAIGQVRGLDLATPWIVDQVAKTAKEKKTLLPFYAGREVGIKMGLDWDIDKHGGWMLGPEFQKLRNEMHLEDMKRLEIKPDQLTAGHSKTVVLPSQNASKKVRIYGGRHANGSVAQPDQEPHEYSYNDHVQDARYVVPDSFEVNGKKIPYREFISDPKYAVQFGFKVTPKDADYAMTPHLKKFVDENKPKQDKSKK